MREEKVQFPAHVFSEHRGSHMLASSETASHPPQAVWVQVPPACDWGSLGGSPNALSAGKRRCVLRFSQSPWAPAAQIHALPIRDLNRTTCCSHLSCLLPLFSPMSSAASEKAPQLVMCPCRASRTACSPLKVTTACTSPTVASPTPWRFETSVTR